MSCPITGDAKLDHLVKVGFTRLPHSKGTFFPLYFISNLCIYYLSLRLCEYPILEYYSSLTVNPLVIFA